MPYLQRTVKWYLTHDTLHEGRLSLTVLTDEGHFLTSFNNEVDTLKDRLTRSVTMQSTWISLPQALCNDWIVSTSQTWRKLQTHGRIVHLIHFYGYYLLQLTDALLHLYGFRGLITKPFDKRLGIGNLLLLVLIGTKLLFATFFPKDKILVILHPIVFHMATGYLKRTVRYIINKCSVVTNQYYSLSTLSKELLQPLD